jgi:hypothetical protein
MSANECSSDEQGPKDGPPQKPSVPPMAPFRKAFDEMERFAQKLNDEWMAVADGDTTADALATARTCVASECCEMLEKALEEATLQQEARRPTS